MPVNNGIGHSLVFTLQDRRPVLGVFALRRHVIEIFWPAFTLRACLSLQTPPPPLPLWSSSFGFSAFGRQAQPHQCPFVRTRQRVHLERQIVLALEAKVQKPAHLDRELF